MYLYGKKNCSREKFYKTEKLPRVQVFYPSGTNLGVDQTLLNYTDIEGENKSVGSVHQFVLTSKLTITLIYLCYLIFVLIN